MKTLTTTVETSSITPVKEPTSSEVEPPEAGSATGPTHDPPSDTDINTAMVTATVTATATITRTFNTARHKCRWPPQCRWRTARS